MIQPFDEIKAECQEIQDFLEITVSDNPEEISSRGNDLAVYIARTGKMLADAKHHQNKARAHSIIKQAGEAADLPASVLSKLVDASTYEENHVVDWCERLNRSATHQMDWCRTLISKMKEEMKYASGISNTYNNYHG